jgi:hypothetical protein
MNSFFPSSSWSKHFGIVSLARLARFAFLSLVLSVFLFTSANRLCGSVQFEISASTSTNSANTGTDSVVQISFFVEGAWTQAETFFSQINSGQTKTKSFNTLSSPSKVKLISTTGDAWGYWKILLDDEIVLNDPNGESGTDYGDNPYWLDGDEAAPAQQEYDLSYSSGDDGGYQSDDGGYQSDDGGYQSDDGG